MGSENTCKNRMSVVFDEMEKCENLILANNKIFQRLMRILNRSIEAGSLLKAVKLIFKNFILDEASKLHIVQFIILLSLDAIIKSNYARLRSKEG